MENPNTPIVQNKIDDISVFKGKWFVVSCYSGSAEKVANNLTTKIKTNKLEHLIFDVRVIYENVKSKRTKKIEKRNLYPGYIFVNMMMGGDEGGRAWYEVRNTEGVTGFIGSSGRGTKPFPLPKIEARKILENIQHKESKKELYVADFEVHDFVKVVGTAFDNQEGEVISLDNSKGFAVVKLEVFGRYTPTQIPYENCKKLF